jgi:hypothetical protein
MFQDSRLEAKKGNLKFLFYSEETEAKGDLLKVICSMLLADPGKKLFST